MIVGEPAVSPPVTVFRRDDYQVEGLQRHFDLEPALPTDSGSVGAVQFFGYQPLVSFIYGFFQEGFRLLRVTGDYLLR